MSQLYSAHTVCAGEFNCVLFVLQLCGVASVSAERKVGGPSSGSDSGSDSDTSSGSSSSDTSTGSSSSDVSCSPPATRRRRGRRLMTLRRAERLAERQCPADKWGNFPCCYRGWASCRHFIGDAQCWPCCLGGRKGEPATYCPHYRRGRFWPCCTTRLPHCTHNEGRW